MKGKMNTKIMVPFLAMTLVSITSELSLAEYHHVYDCLVCHSTWYGEEDCDGYTNLSLIYCTISTPNSGPRDVVFTCNFDQVACDEFGTYSYADGDNVYDGVCEVCHTQTRHHRNDGNNPDPDPHYAGENCIVCHSHADEFSHGGGPGVGCDACHGHDEGYEYEPGKFSEGAGTVQAHSIHTENDADDVKGPFINCGDCHDTENYPYFESGIDIDGDGQYNLTETDVCDACHSPNGAYDGVGDPAIGAINNWGTDVSDIYDANGNFKAGKERWCVGCHDDGSSVIQGAKAPNISGQSLSGDWQSPSAVVDSDIEGAENLLDNNQNTGNTSSSGSYMIFDLGGSVDISHLRFHVTLDSDTRWKVYGGNDLVEWTRILFGQSILGGGPAWQVGPWNGWNEIRIDRFIPLRYIKLVRVSGGPLPVPVVSEFEFKADLEYGYYTNGHKISCDNCHNMDSTHLDGIAQTYVASSNNYQWAYRLNDVEVDGGVVAPLEIPRVECNSQQYSRTSNDFALCFACHDKHNLLGDAYALDDFFRDPLHTNFRNDDNPDVNGNVTNEHLRHLGGRGYCGNAKDWDSDGDGMPDSPQSCTACHNVHGSPTPAMTRHGDLAGTTGSTDKAPMFNLQYIDETGTLDRNLSDVMESIGGQTQFYGAGPGIVEKNKTCNMCHNDQIIYYRTPIPDCSGLPLP